LFFATTVVPYPRTHWIIG